MAQLPLGTTTGGAVLSPCGRFRYSLTRGWGVDMTSKPALLFVMLNPSTADHSEDDPTIRKCIGFAKRLGFLGLEVVNLYAYRATKPRDLKAAGYPVGESNDLHIHMASRRCDRRVVCAWGANARGLARPAEVLALLRRVGSEPHALWLCADGTPSHPLMLSYTCGPRPLSAGGNGWLQARQAGTKAA